MSDDLTRRFAGGDERALREAFDAHGPLVLGLCRRAVGGEAEDVAQQVFVAAWRSRSKLDPERGSLAGWLTGITKFKIIDHLRAKGRRPVPADDEPRPVADPSPSGVARIADRLLVNHALDQLPTDRRTVIELAFFDDLTHQQISDRLGLPLGTVKSHIRRGLSTLRDALDGQDLAPTGTSGGGVPT